MSEKKRQEWTKDENNRLLMMFFAGRSYRSMAREFGISESAVKRQVIKVAQRYRQRMDGEETRNEPLVDLGLTRDHLRWSACDALLVSYVINDVGRSYNATDIRWMEKVLGRHQVAIERKLIEWNKIDGMGFGLEDSPTSFKEICLQLDKSGRIDKIMAKALNGLNI